MSALSIDIAGQKRFLGGFYHQGYKMRTCVLNASIDSLRYFSYALVDLTTYITLTKTDSSDLVLSQFRGRDLQNSKDIAPVYRGTTELWRLGLVQWRQLEQRTLLKIGPCYEYGTHAVVGTT